MSDIIYREGDLRIIKNDILTTRSIRNESVDLIVTSPPYNLDINYGLYKDQLPYPEYLELFKKWMTKLYNLTKPDGRMCLNVPLDKSKGGYQSVGADVTNIAKQVGWKYKTSIVWNEGNISKNSAWGSWLSASAPHIIAPVELIIVFYKHQWKKESGSKISTITKEEFVEWTRGIWTFKGESKRKIGHPAPYPVELPCRCIKLLSYENDIVMDPFMGSGSTLLAALKTKRRCVGVDIDEKYCNLAIKRINATFKEMSSL